MSETRWHTFGSRFLTVGLLLWLTASVFAQTTAPERASRTVQRSSLTITASATGDRVRIAAPASVVQMRLEVYGAGSEKLFDQEIRGGNVFDWHVQDGQAQRLAAGTYICVVTAKSISGKLTQKMGTVIVEEKSVSVQPADSQQLSVQQAQTIGPVEENPSWTIPGKDEQQTTTVIAHDGTDGQLTRGRGALSFRIGDFFSGNDTEQMRLTEDGNLGIGTAKPKAKLDVAGMIRAREGLLFSDGSKLNVNDKGALTLTNSNGNVAPNIAGSGTQDRIAKWTDNAGTLGDSLISESNGSVVVGNAAQTGNIQIFGTAGQDVFAGMGPDPANGPAFNYGYAGSSFGRSAGFFNVRPDAAAVAPNPSLRFMTANVQRMIITNTGNVGIGETQPSFKLHLVDPSNTGLRVQTNIGGGTVASFGGNGDFQIDAVNVPGGRLVVKENGNVGIGTSFPSFAKLEVQAGSSGGIFGGSINSTGVNAVTSFGVAIVASANSTATNLVEGYSSGPRKFHITTSGTYVSGSDFAEALPARGGSADYEPGDVLVVSAEAPGKVEKTSRRNDVSLAGVYSTRPGMLGADKNGTSRVDADELPVAIIGIVPTKVSTENGPVRVGDLLTTSSTPGYAMKASPVRVGGAKVYRSGTILGKALEPLKEGKGVIKVLVTMR